MVDIMSFFLQWPSPDAPISLIKIMFGLLAFTAVYILLHVFSYILLGAAKHVVKRTKTTLDDELVIAIQTPVEYGIFLFSLFVFISYISPTFTILDYPISLVFKILIIALVAFTINKLVKTTINWYYSDSTSKMSVKLRKEAIPLFSKSISAIIYISAGVIILHQLGIEVGPLLAGLGIAGLAVALALQDSLANFFAGMYLLADKPVKVHDFIKLEDGNEGYVQEIGWRSTRIKTISNNVIIIPNNKLAASTILNYSLPTHQTNTEITIGVSYSSDPEEVEKALLTSAENSRKKRPDMIADTQPVIRLFDFSDFTIIYKLYVPINSYPLKWEVSTLLRKEILHEFRKRGIEIPFPIRTVYMKKER